MPTSKRRLDMLDADGSRDLKKRKQDEVELVVDSLWCSKSEADFPVRCQNAVASTIGPIIGENNGASDNFLVPLQSPHGKKLTSIILLGTACAVHGLQRLSSARNSYDESKIMQHLAPTRSWVAWVRSQRSANLLLRSIKLTKWSSVSHVFDDDNDIESLPDELFDDDTVDSTPVAPDDEWAAEIDEAIAKCFADHTPEETTAGSFGHCNYIHGFDCDCCLKTYDPQAPMYRCGMCDLDYCNFCWEKYNK